MQLKLDHIRKIQMIRRQRKRVQQPVVYRKGIEEYKKPSWARQTDWYKIAGNKREYRNPHAAKHGICHPCRVIIDGPTGSGKTQTLFDIIRIMDNFDEVYVLSIFGTDDPLYALLTKMFTGKCIVTSSVEELPTVSDIPTDDDIQRAFIFDDVLALPNAVMNRVMEYYTAVRKCNASCFMCIQSYFGCGGRHGKVIKQNADKIFILPGVKEQNQQDLKLIASRYGKVKEIEQLYDECARQGEVFWIDCAAQPEKRFRIGFDRCFLPS
jgi:hypothetical protein